MNSRLSAQAVKDTQELIAFAQEGKEESPCFWLRGLVPKEWTQTPEATGRTMVIDDDPWDGGIFYVMVQEESTPVIREPGDVDGVLWL